jgi:hypothetical protein
MTSTELHQKIAAFVADRLNEDEYRARVRNTVKPCDDCAPSFTRDLVARMALPRNGRQEPSAERGRMLRDAPGGAGTAREPREPASADASQIVAPDRSLGDVVTTPGVVIALALVVAAVAFLLGGEESTKRLSVRAADEAVPVDIATPQPQNLFNEAVNSFSRIASGEVGVQVPGEKRREVEEYFAKNGVSYSVRFPSVALPLAGGIVSRYGGRAFAQLVYSAKDRAIYVVEVPAAELRGGTRLYVTADVLARLEKGERIGETTAEGQSLVMFRDGDLVIAAVGNMEPQELQRAVRGG